VADALGGKVAVVTGAGRGIGRATALLLGRMGAAVVVNDIGVSTSGEGADPQLAAEVASEIVAAGGRAVANADTVTDFEAAGRIIAAGVESFGGVDILVNNAGLSAGAPIAELSPELFARVTAVHMAGTFHCTRHAIASMRERGGGRIVNLVSRSGLTGVAGGAAYGAGKGGIFGFTNVASRELAPLGITVNGVNPSSTDTRMVTEAIDAARRQGGELAKRADNLEAVLQSPEQVATVIAALCSEQAAAISGQFFFVCRNQVGLFQPLTVTQSVDQEAPWEPGDLVEALCGLELHPLDSPY
jgi:NAD(P)-dependent dehydrogenase (short-subunit alcohol dehydrogenase family)